MTPKEVNLATEVKRLNKMLTKIYGQQSLAYSFLRGVVSGLGSVIGATLVVGALVYVLRNVNLVPIIGDWLAQIFSHVVEALPKQ